MAKKKEAKKTEMKKIISIDSLLTEPTKELEGARLELEDYGITLIVRRAGGWNTEYTLAYEQMVNENRARLLDDSLSDFEFDMLLAKVYSKSVLVGWENVIAKDGTKILWSVEQAERILKYSREIYMKVHYFARNLSNFQEAEEELIKKP